MIRRLQIFKILVIVTILTVALEISSQVTTGELLKKSVLNPSSEISNQSISFLQGLDYSLPLMEKIEFRTETNRLTTSRQQFMLRTSFNSLAEKRAVLNKRNTFLSLKNIENLNTLHSKIKETYQNILQLSELKREFNFESEKLALLKKQLEISETILSSGLSYDLADFYKLKISIQTSKLKLLSLEDNLLLVNKQLKLDQQQSVVDIENLITIEIAADLLKNLSWDIESNPEIHQFIMESDYLQSSFDLDKAKSQKILDFVQLEYTVREDLLLENRFSVGVGLQLPWRGYGKINKSDFLSKQNLLEKEKELNSYFIKEQIEKLTDQFFLKHKQYIGLLEVINDPEMKEFEQKLIHSGRIDPIKMIKIYESDLENTHSLKQLENAAIKIYIDILHNTGLLYRKPYKNYLSPVVGTVIE
ncbi:MAG: hypothetical protein IPM42_20505 [Saprospiraceae bacterium]|nr:hypothetical protein [Saprospiraceae bacterium]